MRTDYLTSIASAHWSLIRQSCTYLKVACSLQTEEKAARSRQLLTIRSSLKAFRATSGVSPGLSAARQFVCSSVKPNVTNRPSPPFLPGLCGIMCLWRSAL